MPTIMPTIPITQKVANYVSYFPKFSFERALKSLGIKDEGVKKISASISLSDKALIKKIGGGAVLHRGSNELDEVKALDLLNRRQLTIVEPGERVPLREGENLCIEMIEGFNRRDIPGILDFYKWGHDQIPQQAFNDVDYAYNRSFTHTTVAGAKLRFEVSTPSDGALLFVELYYNDQKIIG